jgi:hypothetical protein
MMMLASRSRKLKRFVTAGLLVDVGHGSLT